MAAAPVTSLLEAKGVVKHFGRTAALDGVDICIAPAEIVGVVGPNGSGKTTLLNIIAGNLRPTAGHVRFQAEDITDRPPHKRARLGIARCTQVVQPPVGMKVREVVMIGALFGLERRAHDVAGARLRADEMLSQLGLADKADRPATTLNIVDRKRLELARALAMEPRLLLLDEVMAGLTLPEVEATVTLVARLRAGGVAVVVVEHVMHAITTLCDRAIVLHRGRLLAEGPPKAVLQDARVVEAYLGRGRAGLPAPEQQHE